jgi:hypothetical protein
VILVRTDVSEGREAPIASYCSAKTSDLTEIMVENGVFWDVT